MPEFELETIDLVIIAVYAVGIVAIGLWVGRKKSNEEDFLLGGRGMTWPLVGFSLIAANFSGTQFLGLAGAGYDSGIAVWNYEWLATIVLLFFSVAILPLYLQSKITTVPEFLELRYDRRSRYAFSGFTVLSAVLIDSAGAMFAGALVLQLLFPDVPLLVHIIVIAVLGGAYVIAGGLQAVMITDTIQTSLLFVVAGVIFYVLFGQVDYQWAAIRELAPENGFTIAPPADDEFLPWPGIFTGGIWLGFYVWVTNHVVVQKVLSAKNIDHGRWGALFAGGMQLPYIVLLIFPGILARQVFEDIPDPDMVWPALIFELIPVGFRGLAVAALLAALMSTLDSVLNGASSLVVNDFIKTRDRDFSEKQLLLISRSMVGAFMVVAALWAPVILRFDTIVEFFQSFLGYLTMPLVIVLLGGIFWKRATSTAAFYTFVIAGPIGLATFFVAEVLDLIGLHFLYGTGLMVLLSGTIFVTLSLRDDAPDQEQIRDFTFTRENWRRESEELAGKPWYANHRYLSLGLLLVTVAVVVPFI
jgi:solute:Na+ symporter, SSS family